MSNKIAKNKIAQGILSLFLIIILLASMLAGSIYFQDNITANSIKENPESENLKQKSAAATITGKVTGMEGVTGRQSAQNQPKILVDEYDDYWYNLPGTNNYVHADETDGHYGTIRAVYQNNKLRAYGVEDKFYQGYIGNSWDVKSPSSSPAPAIITAKDSQGNSREWYPIDNSGNYFSASEAGSQFGTIKAVYNSQKKEFTTYGGTGMFSNYPARTTFVAQPTQPKPETKVTLPTKEDTAAPAGGQAQQQIKAYERLELAQQGWNNKEFKIGDKIKIGNTEYTIRGTLASSASEEQQPVLFKGNLQTGETLYGGNFAYLNQQQIIITQIHVKAASEIIQDSCSGNICRDLSGGYLPSSQFQSSKQKTFFVQTQVGYTKLDADNQEAAEKEILNKYGDPNLKPVRGDKIPAEKQATAESLLAGRQKYIIQIRKPDGSIVIKDDIWATTDSINTIAKNQAELIGGDIIVAARPRFTVNVPGIGQFKDVEANNADEAKTKKINDLNDAGIPTSRLSITAEPQAIGQGSVAKLPSEYSYKSMVIDSEEKHLVISPDGAIQNYKTKEEAQKVIADFNEKLTIQKYEKSSEDNAKKQSLNLQNLRSENGLKIAKDSKGKFYIFDKATETYNQVTTSTFNVKETIGSGDNAVGVTRAINSETGKQTKVIIEKDGQSAIVDEATIKTITNNLAKGLSVRIQGENPTASRAPSRLTNEPPPGSIIEFSDQNGVLRRETRSQGWTPEKGTNLIDNYQKKYIDKDGKLLTNQKDIGDFVKNGGQPTYEVSSFENIVDGKLDFVTSYNYKTISRDKEKIRVSQGLGRNAKTGKVERFEYGEKDSKGDERMIVIDDEGNVVNRFVVYADGSQGADATNTELDGRAQSARTKYKSQQFFANLESSLTEFRGLGYFGTLFLPDKFLHEWREGVDKAFAKTYMGTEYWSSAICAKKIDSENEGIAFAETPQGFAQIGAHVEATRTKPIATITTKEGIEYNGTEYIYKITFNVRNGDYEKDLRAPEEMPVNVILKGERTVILFKQDQKVKRGSSFGKSGKNAIVSNSTTLYTQICLKFEKDKMPLRWKIDGNELCNKIQETSEEPTQITIPSATAQQKKAQEAELNDF